MDDTRASRGSAELSVWQLSILMAAGAVAAAAPRIGLDVGALAWPSIVCLVLTPASALAEIVVIHLPAQRSSHSHTLRELPAIAGPGSFPLANTSSPTSLAVGLRSWCGRISAG